MMNARSILLHQISLLTILLAACGTKIPAESASPASVAAAAGGATDPSTGQPSTDQTAQMDLSGLGQIAFMNHWGWYSVINADGSGIQELADPLGVEHFVSYIQGLAYPTGDEHFIYGVASCSAAWSPTATHLAVISDGNIYVLSADGASAQKITATEDVDYCIDWSPYGDYLAFSSTRANVKEPSGQAFYTDIFTIRPDGSELRKITSSDQNCDHPRWSPDGNWLVFDCMFEGRDIYLGNKDGSRLEKLSGDGTSRNPVWSPDGNSIAFESRGGGSDHNRSNIYVMDLNGENVRKLTTNNHSFLPRWSPDGKLILFRYSPLDHNDEIRLMDADGKNKRQLIKNIELDSVPSWSPDARYIVYGSGTIQILEVASGHVVKSVWGGYGPFWSPTAILQLPDCTAGWTRLTPGGQARVMQQSTATPNRLRSNPSTSGEIIGQISLGSIVTLLEGPVCADGLVFWKVKSDLIPGGSGWSAEGDGNEYWLELNQP